MLNLPLRAGQITWLFRLALLLNLLVISWFAFSTQTWSGMPELLTDKVNHFIAFFVLSYCIDRGFPRYRFLVFKVPVLMAYGLAIELIQSQIPGREISGLDLLADAGAIAVYWLVRHPMRTLLLASRPDSD
ncbi:VanZ family protein [Ketobacter sp.]|uniref:VanZ family protein n=1 Tax=Ketobacter sp. TaxID=2083498 RepID=UPI000F284950|nr:VanZ family protein [Ketobacter sp.]RLU01468.1 MAG: VanZ family protein [Ketobacter sp.]